MKNIILLVLFLYSHVVFSQNKLVGKVVDTQKQAVFAANVYWKNNIQKGTTTDFDGFFEVDLVTLPDTLVVSFIGFETQTLLISKHKDTLHIVLKNAEGLLQEISVLANDPIAQEFSVTKIDKMQIYTNPIAAGDALKAITLLPASTNTDETANPVLRGSSADRSRIILNGVPIYNPVRNSQLNGLGNFSLFNTELIHKMYVYASNPPLTFGNSSAGLVEIETIKELKYNQLQVSLSLANVGAFLSKTLGKKNFLQVYSNRQFSQGFIGLNQANLPRLNNFKTTDVGCHTSIQLSEKVNWKSFLYLIDEGFSFNNFSFTYEGKNLASKKRGFLINNFSKKGKNDLLTFNTLADISGQDYQFGNLQTHINQKQFFAAANYKYFGFKKISFQTGVQYDYVHYQSNDSVPQFYYAISPQSANYFITQKAENHNLEWYFYYNWDISSVFSLSIGNRLNVPINQQKFYTSKQFSLRYQPTPSQHWLLSAGNYHNYSTPNYLNTTITLLDSWQAALDYQYKKNTFELSTALFYKQEGGEQNLSAILVTKKINTVGFEIALRKEIGKYFSFNIANTFLSQNLDLGNEKVRSADDMLYFLKAIATFSHPKIFTFSLSYVTREGKYFTPIISSAYNTTANAYEPIRSSQINSAQYGNYHNLSVTINRYFPMGKTALIAFASVNNLLNVSNERDFIYQNDYKNWSVDTYQLRTIYMGLVWQWNK